MLKVITIVGTRPELIKMSRVISEFDKYTKHVLVHTGQNYDYELNQVFFDDLEIRKPDHFLNVSGDNPAQAIGNVVIAAYDVLLAEKPDALLLYGDTNSCLAVIAAKRLKIPVFHMEAGNRCFDERVPEELNRKILDHLSDINMVLTEHARRYLIAEGIKPETIIKTGSHMQEVLNHYLPSIEKSDILQRLGLSVGKYFIVSAHREENVDTPENLLDLVDTFNALSEKYGFPVIVSTHPRTQNRLMALGDLPLHENVQFLKPFGFCDYIKLQQNSHCVVSDSGTITEEASLLGFSAVTIRQVHERPEGMDVGTLIMCGLKAKNVLSAVNVVTNQDSQGEQQNNLIPDYDTLNVSKKVLRIVFSYVDYVNRVVWFK